MFSTSGSISTFVRFKGGIVIPFIVCFSLTVVMGNLNSRDFFVGATEFTGRHSQSSGGAQKFPVDEKDSPTARRHRDH